MVSLQFTSINESVIINIKNSSGSDDNKVGDGSHRFDEYKQVPFTENFPKTLIGVTS